MWTIKTKENRGCPYVNKFIPFKFTIGVVFCEEPRNAIKFNTKWQAEKIAEIVTFLGGLQIQNIEYEKINK